MTIKIISLLMILIIGATIVSPIAAQENLSGQAKKVEKVREKVKKLGTGEQVKVKVKLNNETSYQGYISNSTEEAFVIVDKEGKLNSIKYSDVKSIGGKNFSTGVKIAIGLGIGFGITLLIFNLIMLSENS